MKPDSTLIQALFSTSSTLMTGKVTSIVFFCLPGFVGLLMGNLSALSEDLSTTEAYSPGVKWSTEWSNEPVLT